MSVAETQSWIEAHKRKPDAAARWNAAYQATKTCAESVANMSGFAAASAYYTCRKGHKLPS